MACTHLPPYAKINNSDYDDLDYEVESVEDLYSGQCDKCKETFYAYLVGFKGFVNKYWIPAENLVVKID